MLAVLDDQKLRARVRFTAAGPADGPLAAQLRERAVPVRPLSVRTVTGTRQPVADVFQQLDRIVRTVRPDVIHANSLAMSRLLGELRNAWPDCACTGHLRDIMKLSGRAVNHLGCLDRLAAVSRATRDCHVQQGLDPRSVDVIYNGVDPERFRTRSASGLRRRLLPGLEADDVALLTVGQICLRKGQLDLARALVRLLPTHENLHWILLGERYSGKAESVDYEQQIHSVFADAGRSRHLWCMGWRADVQQWMNAADCLVHPARQEPLGRVLLEAAASELPIVATDVGGTREIVDDRSAVLVPAGNVDVLAESLDRCLRDRQDMNRRARRAAATVRRSFSVSAAAAALSDFWIRAAAAHGR